MKKRFIVIVLDGFGIGATSDTHIIRPQDKNASTLGSILADFPTLKLPNLEKLGLMNAFGKDSLNMKKNPLANYGMASLMHFGADTFMGHQEIMGTLPKKPDEHPFQEKLDAVYNHLIKNGHKVDIIKRNNLSYLLVDDYVTVADNLEADLGMCYNVTAPLDFISFDKEVEIAKKVREVVTVGRVIVFGGTGNTMQDLWNAEEIKEGKYIGIASSKSKSYKQGYQCLHLGYGIDPSVQVPTILGRHNIPCILIGKVADIVTNDKGKSISCVDTYECLNLTSKAIKDIDYGFICTNVQETDLAGHSQNSAKYKEILEIADESIGRILNELSNEDILVVMADHGNDPDIGHSKHTRENVPLLIKYDGYHSVYIGNRNSLSDVGASVCDFFNVELPENGISFMNKFK